jgi:hypothetical protein
MKQDDEGDRNGPQALDVRTKSSIPRCRSSFVTRRQEALARGFSLADQHFVVHRPCALQDGSWSRGGGGWWTQLAPVVPSEGRADLTLTSTGAMVPRPSERTSSMRHSRGPPDDRFVTSVARFARKMTRLLQRRTPLAQGVETKFYDSAGRSSVAARAHALPSGIHSFNGFNFSTHTTHGRAKPIAPEPLPWSVTARASSCGEARTSTIPRWSTLPTGMSRPPATRFSRR